MTVKRQIDLVDGISIVGSRMGICSQIMEAEMAYDQEHYSASYRPLIYGVSPGSRSSRKIVAWKRGLSRILTNKNWLKRIFN
ncbi:MAG: hypothetical protein KKA31_03655 [Candidatus Margulisbacteria bacterium]|nr:hypothetical protein [Candidatus Margulisiibacteriota bacterium]